MPSSLPLTSASWVDAPGGKQGQTAFVASNGRMNVITLSGYEVRIFSALTTDTSFTLTQSFTPPGDVNGYSQKPRFAANGDELHLLCTRYFDNWSIGQGSTYHGSWYWRLGDIAAGTISATSYQHDQINQGANADGVRHPTLFTSSDGTTGVVWWEIDAFRSMGSNYNSPIIAWSSSSASWAWSEFVLNNTTTDVEGSKAWVIDSTTYMINITGVQAATLSAGSASRSSISVGNVSSGYIGAGSFERYLNSEIFYNSTRGVSYQLAYDHVSGVYVEVEGDADGTSFGGTNYTVPTEVSTGQPACYYYDEPTDTATIIYQKDGALYKTERVHPATTYSTPGIVYQHSGLASYTNGKPVALYKSGGTLYGLSVFGATGDAEVVWDIDLVALGEIDVDVAISRTYSTKSISADIDLDGFAMAVAISKAYASKSVSSTLFAPELGLTQGWESRYQANEAGQLLERNLYRAYVGATEFPLYSISASFSGLHQVTGDPAGGANISLKVPADFQDWLTSQIGQEFIVLNGVEIAGVFQGVEFVRGIIDDVRRGGNLVVVSSTSTEAFASGVEVTIDKGVEFVSRQRIRVGQINPTLRPGARVVTDRGTFDISQLTYFVGPNQKFMEFAVYG